MTVKQIKPEASNNQSFRHPKYWGIWFGLLLLRCMSLIPYRYKFATGKVLGALMYRLAGKRRKIAMANIQLAFPDKSFEEQNRLLKKHFASLGISLMEMTIVWYGNHKQSHSNAFERHIVHFTGEENLRIAQEKGKGVLILAPHFTTLELTGLFISFLTNYHAVYRPHDNPLVDHLIAKGRSIRFDNGETVEPVSNSSTRQMLKILRRGESMTFLPDQRYRANGSIKVPLFSKDCPSNPATSKIARLTGCSVVPTFTRRIEDANGVHYEVEFLPALENFPSEDNYQDTLRLHQLYEEAIRRSPEQYLWVHNRWDLKI